MFSDRPSGLSSFKSDNYDAAESEETTSHHKRTPLQRKRIPVYNGVSKYFTLIIIIKK